MERARPNLAPEFARSVATTMAGWTAGRRARARSSLAPVVGVLASPWPMLLVGVICGVAQVLGGLPTPGDALNYWLAGSSPDVYPDRWGDPGAGQWLFYPPPVIQISRLLQPIGWPVFTIGWTTLIFGACWYCARAWALPLVAVGLLPVAGIPIPVADVFLTYALLGNMQWLLAALVVLSLRLPALWALLAITKTGPAIGGLWHLFRRDWHAVRVAVLTTAAVVVVSAAFDPALWADWLGFVVRNVSLADPPLPLFQVPFPLRLVIAAGVVAWAARSDEPWLVPIAAGLAVPALYGLSFMIFWTGSIALIDRSRSVGQRAPTSVTPGASMWGVNGRA